METSEGPRTKPFRAPFRSGASSRSSYPTRTATGLTPVAVLATKVYLDVMKPSPIKTSFSAAIFVFASLLLSLHDRSFAQQPSAKKQEIYNLLAARRYEQAAQAATAYLATNPGDCSANVFLGLAYRGEAKLKPASKA